ncbi:MAG TPA: DUF423 domain-containing protein [Flavobacteriaceae bacterium]|nr:DUF423 domain-containing protein [Flavobacteriaceae bacterium]
MNRFVLLSGTILGVIAVILGAFGAHGLKALISAEAIQTFETGIRYQMYHAFLLLIVGNQASLPLKTKRLVGFLVLAGVLFFSGSIYLLSTNTLTAFDFKQIAFITPAGGLLLIFSWLVLLINFLKNKL